MTSCDNHETFTSFTSTKMEKNKEEKTEGLSKKPLKMNILSVNKSLKGRPKNAKTEVEDLKQIIELENSMGNEANFSGLG